MFKAGAVSGPEGQTPSLCSCSDLCALLLRLGGQAGGVLLGPLHAHKLHLRLGEAEYESRQQGCDGQSVGQGQTHQT